MSLVIDCTLRDGGYYCDWDFDEVTVRKYLAAVATAKIDIIEVGFRLFPQDRFLGPFAYSTDDYLKTLPLPIGVFIAVMVNAKDLINHERGIDSAINSTFNKSDESPVDIVRVAAHASEISECKYITQRLSNLGYQVMLNIMQIDSLGEPELIRISREISTWGSVDVLYFADSFGSMGPESVNVIVKALLSGWGGAIGIHTHDNKGQALSNCIAALHVGVTYFDGTLLGMGRGAGNVKTENLLVELTERGYGQYYADAVFPLVIQDFQVLHDRYRWGPNIYYFLSAVHGIHPTYIQEMIGDQRYGTEQILSAINFLKSTRAPFYSFDNMLRAISGMVGSEHGSWSVKNWIDGRSVLIIGAGPRIKRYITALQQYIDRNKPIVLCLNINESVPAELVTAYVACHETRILIESDLYPYLKRPLILPLCRVPSGIRDALINTEILDYGLRIEEGSFQIGDNGCVLDSPLALAYAISIATAGGAAQVLFAGIDGYDLKDKRQQQVVDVIERYKRLEGSLPIVAITPTTYPVQQRSLYEPHI